MSVFLKLTLPWPPSGNQATRHVGKMVLESRESRDYKKRVRLLTPHTPIAGPVTVSGRLYRPTRQGDLANRLKILEDALQGVAYLNDSQIHRYLDLGWAAEPDPDNPRVELELVGERWATSEEIARGKV